MVDVDYISLDSLYVAYTLYLKAKVGFAATWRCSAVVLL